MKQGNIVYNSERTPIPSFATSPKEMQASRGEFSRVGNDIKLGGSPVSTTPSSGRRPGGFTASSSDNDSISPNFNTSNKKETCTKCLSEIIGKIHLRK